MYSLIHYQSSMGSPQGSILGPLLLIICINDISSVVKYCHVQLYADDTLLYVRSPTVNVIESKLSEDMERIMTWLNGKDESDAGWNSSAIEQSCKLHCQNNGC